MVYKDAAKTMEELIAAQRLYFARPNEDALYLNMFSEENPLTGKTLDDLRAAFAVVVKKADERGLVMHIGREQITLHDRLDHLYGLIKRHPHGINFFAAFEECQSKMGLIVTFLALLELMRQSVVKIMQNNVYGEIYLYPGELDKYERE